MKIRRLWLSTVMVSAIANSIVITVASGFASLPVQGQEVQERCRPKALNTHACLPTMPTYSYNLALPSDYQQAFCLELGRWEGSNTIVVEWDGLQSQQKIVAQPDKLQYLQPEQRSGRGSGLIVYSEQPIFPQVQMRSCSTSGGAVTSAPWPSQPVAQVVTPPTR